MDANVATASQNTAARARSRGQTRLTLKQRFLTVSNLLFIVLLLIAFLPNATGEDPQTQYLLAFATAVEAASLIGCATASSVRLRNSTVDIVSVLFGVLIAWTLATCKYNVLPESIFPAPGVVLAQIIADAPKICSGIGSSIGIIAEGFVLGGACALVLGLLLGYNARSSATAHKIVSFLAAIPPVVYIPYGIVLLPTFRSASVMVIFLATFWPVLTATLSGVSSVDQQAIDSARSLNVSRPTMLFKVLLPAALPLIFNGLNIGLTLSFILLTSAEMIGGNSGMGYYVKYYSDFGDFTRILAGIIVIGVVITCLTLAFGKLQQYLLRWK